MGVFCLFGFKIKISSKWGLNAMNGAKFVDQLKFQATLLNTHCDGDFKAIYGLILQADWSNTLAFAIPRIRWCCVLFELL